MPQPVSDTEFARLSALFRYGVLDTPPEPEFDVIVADLAATLEVPMAQLLFADLHRFVSKATVGLPTRDLVRAGSLPDPLVGDKAVLDVPDLFDGGADRRGALDGVSDLRAFLGVRLQTPDQDAIGALFVADRRPRWFGPDDLAHLEAARDAVMAQLESRRRGRLDPATEALARGPFIDQVTAVIEASQMGKQPVSLVMIDVAAVRAQLDAAAPGLGRLITRRLSDLGRDQVRHRDSFGRLDEDRFAVLLTDTDEAGATVLRQRLMANLRQGWEAMPAALDLPPVTIGTATWRPGDVQEPYALLQAAAKDCSDKNVVERPAMVA